MLLPVKVARGVADGSMDLAFRRWKRQDVEPGRTFKTVAGVVRVEEVTVVDPDTITDEEAVRAGHPDAERLRSRLAPDASLATSATTCRRAARSTSGAPAAPDPLGQAPTTR